MDNNNIKADPDELKAAVSIIKKCLIELKNSKERADNAWEQCSPNIDKKYINLINENKKINNKNFNKAIEDLEYYANSLNSIADVWKDSEREIESSFIEFESLFSNLTKASNIIKNVTIDKK